MNRLTTFYRKYPLAMMTPLALVVLTLLWALFFWRVLTPNTVDRVVFPEGDFTQHYYAFSAYQVGRLAQGEFPLWNPYNHAGDPFAANIQFVAFYPPRLIAALLVGENWSIEGYQVEVAAHYWLASVMAFAFFLVLVRRPAIALFGSVLYTYSGYLTGYPMLQVSVLESVVWLPLILLGAHLASRKSLRWVVWGSAIGGIGVALSLLGGHPQTTMQLTYLAIAYIAFMAYMNQLGLFGFILRAGLLGTIGVGLSAIQLLPAAEFTSLSYRVTQLGFEDKANGFFAGEFLQVIWPELFGTWSPLYLGAGGLLLALGAMLRPKAVHLFWMGVIALGLFLSFGGNSIVFDAFYLVVPGFSIFRQQERIASVIVFALVTLAVYQLHWLLSEDEETGDKSQVLRFYSWLVYGYVAFLIGVYVLGTVVTLLSDATNTQVMHIFGFVAITGTGFAAWYTWARRNPTHSALLLVAPLLLLLVVDLFTIGTRSENYLPDIPENRVQLLPELQPFQTEPQDIRWRIDGAASLQGNGVLFNVPDIYGTGPFSLASVEELRLIPVQRFWEVLSVRYITTLDEPPTDLVDLELLAYDANYTGDEYRLFEIVDPRPMAHLVYDSIDAQGSAEFARQIMSDNRVNLRETAVTLNPLPIELSGERPEVSTVDDFTIITPEHIEMTVSTQANALLTISMMHYPGWRATVNGESVEIVDTYAGMIGIPIEAGEDQRVRLEFISDTVRLGAILTLLTLLGVMVASVLVGVASTGTKPGAKLPR